MAAPGSHVVRPSGELTSAALPAFDALLRPHMDGRGTRLVIDLASVTFLTSKGLSALVAAGRAIHERGGVVALAGGRRSVVKLLRLTGLDAVMPHFATVAAAEAYLVSG